MEFLLLLILAALVVIAVLLWQQSRRRAAAPAGTAAPTVREDPFAEKDSVAGDPRSLKTGDMVDYLGTRFFVRGTAQLREGGYRWSEHFLDDMSTDAAGSGSTKRWLSVEEDPDLQVVLWTDVPDSPLRPTDATVTVDGVTYTRVEHGTADYRADGTTGLGQTGKVEYVDYEAPGGRHLSFERYGDGRWSVGVGEQVPQGTLTIYPAS